MVKLVGRHHVKAMRAFVRRKQAFQERQLAREKEAALPTRELPEYDPDDNGRFAGYDAIFKCEGRHYEALCRVLKKILRPAHYRTWLAANGELVNGPAPCLSAKEIAERVGRHRRTIEIDLQEMREKRLLHLQPAQREGRWVMEMHYDVLYRLVHEYLEWERSTDYIPPERQYFERLEIDPDLRQHLLQFEDYRKVLVKKKPGPKGKSIRQEICPARPDSPGSDRQHTYSDAPILPAASQGGMKRSVNLEPSAPPALPQAGVSGSISPMAPAEPYDPEAVVSGRCQQEDSPMQNTYARGETVRREAFYEKETEKLPVVAPVPAANQDHYRRVQGQPGRPAGRQDRKEVSPVEVREQAACRQRADVRKKREDNVNASSVFSYGSREIVHGGAAGVTYPAIVPLLRDFMQKKLLGGDAAMRYFVAYERLGIPHIERAFPPGTDGVWIWRQDPDQSVHVKPTCSALDPALKNRNLSLLSVAVGRLSDDDGSFYFDEPASDSASGVPPGRQNRSNDRRPREAPAGAAIENGRRQDAYSADVTTEASARQQGQDRYRALLKRAKDGNGKGLQRLF